MQPKVDKALNGFVEQLFAQRRHSALRGPRGGAIVSDPMTADEILRDPDRFQKPSSLFWALGRSRFNTNGTEWSQRRELTQRGYLQAGTSQNRSKIAEAYQRRLDQCPTTQPEVIVRALFAASADIFFGALGVNFAVEPMLSVFDRVRDLLKRIQYFSLVPASTGERTALEGQTKSLLQDYALEIARSPELRQLADRLQIRGTPPSDELGAAEELLMNSFAGVESTTATLSIAIDRLGAYADEQERLSIEVQADGDYPKLECFIKEILRYHPAIPFIARQIATDAEIEGQHVRPGGVIIISIAGIHRHPDYWSNPDRFDPRRSELVCNTYDRRAFIPFSAGPRVCGGAKLASLELSERLKAFIRRFAVARRGDEISFDYAMAIRPTSWDRVTIVERQSRRST